MTRTFASLLLGVVLVAPAEAHDFWLKPESFRIEEPETVTVRVRVGHGDDLASWPVAPSRIVSFASIGPDGVTDQQARLGAVPAAGVLEPDLPGPGLHVLSFASTHAVSDLRADRFNRYVEEEGVRPIRKHREARGTMDTRGREIYSRRGKSLILVGNIDSAADDHVTRPIGMTLEIIPLTNPLRLAAEDALEFEVRYQGFPLAGATVHVQSLDGNGEIIEPLTTDADGHATFDPEGRGAWMLHTVWSSPIVGDARADYDTTFSSLTFSFAGQDQ